MESSNNFYHWLLAKSNRDGLRAYRKVENINARIARWTNNRNFLIRCKKTGITPKGIRLISAIQGKKAEIVLQATEKKLLRIRLTQAVNTLKFLNEKYDRLIAILKTKLAADLTTRVDKQLEDRKKCIFDKTREKQVKKYNKLVEERRKDQEKHAKEQESVSTVDKKRWVINKSDHVLNEGEQSVLEKGLNFAVMPKKLPVHEIIKTTEEACWNMKTDGERDSLRADVVKYISKVKMPKSNISKEEFLGLKSLTGDKTITIVPADKGRATVIMKKEEYEEKMKVLLSDTNTYKKLDHDPTKEYKKDMKKMIDNWEKEKPLPPGLKRFIQPTSENIPAIYGTPKIHKSNYPLRPIVSGIGSITYNAAKVLTRILQPLVGQSDYHIQNSNDFVDKIKDKGLSPGLEMLSYDVSALFTSIPVDEAIRVIRQALDRDKELTKRTPLNVDQICELLQFCLNTTYFTYQHVFYQQTHGAAMGSPVSPIVANLYMEDFEKRAIQSAPEKPRMWYRYVDDTFVVMHEYDVDTFTQHLNSQNRFIKFTTEKAEDGRLPFLDTKISFGEDGQFETSVYRKPTHTDAYLNFASNHPVQHKRSVVNTLVNRARKICSSEEQQEKEIDYSFKVLKDNGYKQWILKEPKRKNKKRVEKKEKGDHYKSYPIPYIQGISEHLNRIFRQHKVPTYYKPINKIQGMLVKPKDKTPPEKSCGVIYEISCGDCDSKYIGETERSLEIRFGEHMKTEIKNPTAVGEHLKESKHQISEENVKIIAREGDNRRRKIHESIIIREKHPMLNRNDGYKLPGIYDNLLWKAAGGKHH